MGTVYEGVNIETGAPAAVKVLSAVLAEEEDFRRRFEDEIEALRKLRHPNIVRLLGFGEHDQRLFYAMELVNGRSLEQELHSGRTFDWREAAEIGIATCRALRHAHDRGIVHRDIKPANLLLDSDGQTKLSDFGIARLFGGSRLTTPGNVLGTVEYMAPEQAGSEPVGPRADLYSLGGVLYVLMARRPPFLASSLAEMIQKQRTAIPEPLLRYCPDAPAEMGAIVAQLLEKAPQKRVANATLLARRLEAMLRALPAGEAQSATSPRNTWDGPDTPTRNLPPSAPAASARGPTRSADSEAEIQISVPLGETSPADAANRPDPIQPSNAAARPPSVDPVGQTRATDAFDEFPPAEGSDQPRRSGDAGRAVSRFVSVKEEDLDPAETSDSPHGAMISPQTGILVAALLAIGFTAWYMLQPPSREALYERISAAASQGTVDSYRRAEDQMKEFLSRFSEDPRCDRLREYLVEIELERLERRLERRAALTAGSQPLSPIERIYLEAIRYARLDTELGMAKLEAIVVLYGSGNPSADDRSVGFGATEQCVELARRRLERLEQQLDESNVDHEAMIHKRLDRADALDQTDPDAARLMREKVIELYDRKPWARESVGRAREALQ